MSRCRTCHAEILWAANTDPGRPVIPIDPVARPDGNVLLSRTPDGLVARVLSITEIEEHYLAAYRQGVQAEPLHVTHFASCPNAAQHRRRRARSQTGATP